MSWGYRITILCLSFVAFMTFLVISAFRKNVDLVTEDYYGKELKFQSQIDKQKNQQNLKESITVKVDGDAVKISFPSELTTKNIEGEILFYRPSDSKKDVRMKLNEVSMGVKRLPLHLFSKGLYKVQIDYKAADKEYYFEETVII